MRFVKMTVKPFSSGGGIFNVKNVHTSTNILFLVEPQDQHDIIGFDQYCI